MQLIKIGDLFLQSKTGEISRDKEGKVVFSRLDNTPLALLMCLLENQHKDVSKRELLDQVWPNKVVSEEIISVVISQIRKAFNDSPKNPKYIKTISGFGYRFIAQTTTVETTTKSKKVRYLTYSILPIITVLLISISVLHSLLKPSELNQNLPKHILEDFQKARYLLTQPNQTGWLEARDIFKDIIIKQHDFAPAYIALVDANLMILKDDHLAKYQRFDELVALTQRALSLDPKDSRAHLQMANITYYIDWNIAQANRHYKTAISLDNSNAEAHFMYAQYLMKTSNFASAITHTNRYIELNPIAYEVPMVAWVYNMMAEYSLAIQELEKLADLQEDTLAYHISAQSIHENIGNFDASFKHLIAVFEHIGYSQEELSTLHSLFERKGLQGVYAWLLDVKKETNNIGQGKPPLSFAKYAIGAGFEERAVNYLLQAKKQRQRNLLNFYVDPKFKLLRQHPELSMLIE